MGRPRFASLQSSVFDRVPRLGNTIAHVGDSITAIGSVPALQFGDGYAPHLWALSGGRLRPVGVYAISGQTSTQIRARFSQALQKRPALVTILCGTNDAGFVGRGQVEYRSGVRTLTGNIASMCEQAIAQGSLPVLCTLPPLNVNGGTNTQISATRAFVKTANEWITNYAMAHGLPLVDFYALLVNSGLSSAGAAGSWAGAANFTSDGTHPNAAGAWLMASAMWAVISPLIPQTRPNWQKDVVNGPTWGIQSGMTDDQLLDNKLWQQNAQAPGVRPDHWGIVGGASGATSTWTMTLGTDPASTNPMVGNVLTITANGLTSTIGLNGAAYSAPHAAPTARKGDLCRFSGRFRKDPALGIQIQLNSLGQSIFFKPQTIDPSANAAITDGAWDFIFRATNDGPFNINLFASGRTGGVSGTLVIGQIALQNLTQQGLDDEHMSRLAVEVIGT